jgi:TolB-like protein
MEKPFLAYEGDAPYFFVSYSHADNDFVFEEMSWIQESGFNLWYDDGIHVGSDWRQSLADALDGSVGLIFLATKNSVVSNNCLKELNFVLDDEKPVFVVQLDSTPLPNLLRLSLSDKQSLIKSEHKENVYRDKLRAALSMLTAPSEPGKEEHSAKIETPRVEHRSGLRRVMIGITMAVIAFFTLGAAIYFYSQMPAAETVQEEFNQDPTTLAVLPFANLSPEPDHAYFASGIHDELMTTIASNTDILVMGRTSVLQYVATEKTAPVIASELAVSNLLTGSIRYANDRVRISMQLVNGKSGLQAWSKTYDRAFADIFVIQSDVASDVAKALNVNFTASKQEPLSEKKSRAYQEYLIAKRMRFDRQVGGPFDPEASYQQVQLALAHDPDLIPALWLLHNLYQNGYGSQDTSERIEQMREVSRRAFESDSLHPISLALKAKEMMWDWNWERAMEYWELSIKVDPGDAINLGDAAWVALALDDIDRATELSQQSLSVDSGEAWGATIAISLQRHLGNAQIALQLEEELLEQNGGRFSLLYAFAHASDEAFNGTFEPESFKYPIDEMGKYYLQIVSAHDMEKFDELSKMPLDANSVRVCSVFVRDTLRFNQTDMAFQCTDSIIHLRAVYEAIKIATDPQFNALRADPRFTQFLKQSNLERFATLEERTGESTP